MREPSTRTLDAWLQTQDLRGTFTYADCGKTGPSHYIQPQHPEKIFYVLQREVNKVALNKRLQVAIKRLDATATAAQEYVLSQLGYLRELHHKNGGR